MIDKSEFNKRLSILAVSYGVAVVLVAVLFCPASIDELFIGALSLAALPLLLLLFVVNIGCDMSWWMDVMIGNMPVIAVATAFLFARKHVSKICLVILLAHLALSIALGCATILTD